VWTFTSAVYIKCKNTNLWFCLYNFHVRVSCFMHNKFLYTFHWTSAAMICCLYSYSGKDKIHQKSLFLFTLREFFSNSRYSRYIIMFLGAFLVPYLLILVLCGIPLFFMETTLGQFASTSCVTLFKICPLFKGNCILRVEYPQRSSKMCSNADWGIRHPQTPSEFFVKLHTSLILMLIYSRHTCKNKSLVHNHPHWIS
jgi:hypothetical protein